MMFDFSDKVIVVTGAAGNLGEAVVKEFLKSNGIVCGLDYKSGRLGHIVNETQNMGAFHPFEDVDLNDREGMIKTAEQIGEEIGDVDIVVNTVGGFTSGERVDQISSLSWKRMMDLNVHSLLNMAAAFIPGMMERQQGKFIAVGSRASLSGSAKTGAYAAAKGALLRLIESMAAELNSVNVQANCVLPGTIDTPQNRHAMPDADTSRWVSPMQVAQVIQFLASSAADSVTGAALPVYGA